MKEPAAATATCVYPSAPSAEPARAAAAASGRTSAAQSASAKSEKDGSPEMGSAVAAGAFAEDGGVPLGAEESAGVPAIVIDGHEVDARGSTATATAHDDAVLGTAAPARRAIISPAESHIRGAATAARVHAAPIYAAVESTGSHSSQSPVARSGPL